MLNNCCGVRGDEVQRQPVARAAHQAGRSGQWVMDDAAIHADAYVPLIVVDTAVERPGDQV
jgi:hypothetical protein